MISDLFELTTRQALVKTSGIVLDKEFLQVFQAIENYSTKQNLNKAMLFTPSQERLEVLKIDRDRFREVIKDLIEFRLVAQVFELVWNSTSNILEIQSYFLAQTETLRDPGLAYEFFLERSFKELQRYCSESNILHLDKAKTIAYHLASGNIDSLGNGLAHLFQAKSFLVPPPKNLIQSFILDLQERIEKQVELIGSLDKNLYYVPEVESVEIYNCFRNEFEARLLPFFRTKNMELHEKIETIEREEAIQEKSLNYTGNWEATRKVARVCLEYPDILQSHGKIFLNTVVKLSILAERHTNEKIRMERDKTVSLLIRQMETGNDIDSLFLRVNTEEPGAITQEICNALKIHKEVLHAEWFTPTNKLMLFALNKIENLKKINQIIHDSFKNTTEYPLYFRELLEKNEKEIQSIFKDSTFLKTYGKNLQAVYLRYIPFYYRIFAWLGIAAIINAGYAKAKSIIKYKQMDRKFQYEKRKEKLEKERLKERLEELAAKEIFQYARFLEQALENFYFIEKKIPDAEELTNFYPAITPLMLEKVCKEYKFTVIENGGFAGGNLIAFPNTPEYFEKKQKLLQTIQEIQMSKNVDPKSKERAKLLEKGIL